MQPETGEKYLCIMSDDFGMHPAINEGIVWARPYRALDFALLMDSEVKDLIEELGIRRISVTEAPLP